MDNSVLPMNYRAASCGVFGGIRREDPIKELTITNGVSGNEKEFRAVGEKHLAHSARLRKTGPEA
jgi:hypothetical protein